MDFRQAREQVSIVQIAEQLGYAYDKSKGRIRPQFEHPNGDKIIISHPMDNSRQMYFNRDGSTDRGSVIDFIKNRLNSFPNVHYTKDMDGVNQVIKQFVNEPIISTYNASKTIQNDWGLEKKPFDKKEFDIKEASLDSSKMSYLIERGLTSQTLSHFKKDIHLVYDKTAKTPYTNIGFPYKDAKDEIVGFELRGQNFKGHARGSDKDEGVWKADMRPYAEQIKDVFLFESAIDAMSFYQIYQSKFNFKDAAFVSFGGAITPNQMDNVIHSYQNAKFYSGFDNDINGHIYDYAFEKRLNPKLEIDVKRVGEEFIVKHKDLEFKMHLEKFSMKAAAELTERKLGLYITKPTQGKDYNEMLKGLNDKAQKQKMKTMKV